jgi:predicted P-loop ATPase
MKIAEFLAAHPLPETISPPPAPLQFPASATDFPLDTRVKRARAYLETIPGAIEGQKGSVHTFKTAAHVVRGFDLPPDVAYDLLAEIHNPRCVPPWSEDELRRKVAEVWSKASDPPRGAHLGDPPAKAVKLRGKRVGAKAEVVPAAAPSEPPPGVPHGWQEQLIWKQDARGNAVRLENCLHNAMSILHEDPRWADVFWLDEFAQEITVRGLPPYEVNGTGHPYDARPLRDDDYTRAAAWLQREFRLIVGVETAAQAIQALAHRRTFHPVREYLAGLTWDGVPRLSDWLISFCGAGQPSSPDDPVYVRAVSRAWLISAVARVMRPGTDCKADHVLILEGRQGIRKSTVFRVLGSPWFTDEIDALGSKDAGMQLQGAWIIELAELDALSRQEISRTKAFLSKSFDRFRPPYGRTVVRFDRQCVFAGSVNHTEYLRDDSGNRRFWPVRCHDDSLDVEGLAGARDQLWAEAMAAYLAGESWWLPGETESLAAFAQDDRASVDVWEDTVAEYLEDLERESVGLLRDRASVTASDVLSVPLERQSIVEEKRVARILRHLGWEKQQFRDEGGKRSKKYFKKTLSPHTPAEKSRSVSPNSASEWPVTPSRRGDSASWGDTQTLQTERVTTSPYVTPSPTCTRVESTGEVLEVGVARGDRGDSASGPFVCSDCGGTAHRFSRYTGTPVCTACWGEDAPSGGPQ